MRSAGPTGGSEKGSTVTTITRLAKQFKLSRSTLLYYDRIGLLRPSGRSPSNYRLYTGSDRQRHWPRSNSMQP